MFPDSKLALDWGSLNKGMRQNKGDYFATHGIGPFLKEELNQSLRKCFFSLNFDESSVNKTSQLMNLLMKLLDYWKNPLLGWKM